ncbi:MAG: Flp pilus assembly complex ATPase component TadA, partial [Clostridium sp.]|nr:Flp pilus assembly complex ATPase component TadA [Clostridium sp.]
MAELRKPVFREDSARSETAELEAVPAVAILQEAMETAVRFRASDIHLEPMRSGVRIRMRIDGRLSVYARYNEAAYPALQAALIARAKVLTGMDISEKRRPQDGRMTFGFGETEVDVRASSLPTAGGEKIALRFFYQEIWCRSLRELGLSGEERKIFREILSRPYGLVLVTGPTGSGKSTTLYTVLGELNREEVNVVTVEEPVEVRLDGISQIPVNTRAGLTFASALRSLLRQDPDIVMVGEIRDRETAEIAVQAALTGRLVLSTLHTGSAAGSITRLLDLGV